MTRIDPIWFLIFSEFFVNLAAGWFGAIFIIPNFSGFKSPFNFFVLTGDILAGIVSLLIAYKLRKLGKEVKL